MDAHSVYPKAFELDGREEQLLDSEMPNGVISYEENCKNHNVTFVEVFSNLYEQGCTDEHAESQTESNNEIYDGWYQTGYDDGYEAGFMSA